uniref:Uncharacterized protein n=1 Tax=Rhizophora mucronata TaxID=61149 RepID=A0A2P2QA09_RHIMU
MINVRTRKRRKISEPEKKHPTLFSIFFSFFLFSILSNKINIDTLTFGFLFIDNIQRIRKES